MKATNCTESDLRKALETVNAGRYDGNIVLSEVRVNGRGLRFRLRARDYDRPGYRRSQSWSRMKNACWHAHGDFFDALFAVAPDAVISAGDKTITREGGNWQDWNIGSMMQPMYYSEACDC